MTVRIMVGDVREQLKLLPDESVHCAVTSPPYFGLRDYGVAGQIGLEPTPDAFVAEMVAVFREVRRALRDDGTLWLNLGDSYASGGRSTWRSGASENKGQDIQNDMARPPQPPGLKRKDLLGIPWRVAFALQADGWYLRQDIIWSKPNPMTESVTDRCTKAHEYVFLLSKSERYYYDAEAIAEPLAYGSAERLSQDIDKQRGSDRAVGKTNGKMKAVYKERYTGESTKDYATSGAQDASATKQRIVDRILAGELITRNKRSVWTVTTQPFKEAHFATFPTALIEPMILAGCPLRCCAKCGAPWVRSVRDTGERRDVEVYDGEGQKEYAAVGVQNPSDVKRRTLESMARVTESEWSASCKCEAETVPGTVLDPFLGSGTTALVADRLGRNAIGCELNPDYAAMARRRLIGDAGMFAEVAE